METYGLIDGCRKFRSSSEQLLTIIQYRINDKKTINSLLDELNKLDYKNFIVPDNNTIMLLINGLCTLIQVSETILVRNYCRFISNLIEAGTNISGRTFLTCKKWIFQVLEFSKLGTRIEALIALKSLISHQPFDAISQDLQNLLGENGLLRVFAMAKEDELSEVNVLAVDCVQVYLLSEKKSGDSLSFQHLSFFKDIAMNVLFTSKGYEQNQTCYNKVICCCLRILRLLFSARFITEEPDLAGQVLGIVQAFLFRGLPNDVSSSPQILRPAPMNLPERVHTPPKGRALRSSTKSKTKKTTLKKTVVKSSNYKESSKIVLKFNDSDTPDSENLTQSSLDSKIRIEAICLLHSAVLGFPSREIFGFWSQIIASGTGTSSRVLIKLILEEPNWKVRQHAVSTLTEAINGAKTFLVHADDSEHPSFLTIFGTVGTIIKEIHFTLSLLLGTEQNVAVITHALKCSSALIQSTPYSKLKVGLATRLARNCRPFIHHKDPTIRVVVLSVFDAFSSTEHLTPEIISILNCKVQKKTVDHDKEMSQTVFGKKSEDVHEEAESEFGGLKQLSLETDEKLQELTILENCLHNISDKTVHVPVRLQSLKLLAALSSNVEDSVLHSLEIVVHHLLETFTENESQVSLHSCRVLEVISSKLSSNGVQETLLKFWKQIFGPVISLAQSLNTNLREVACDCLGSINNIIFSQLTRRENILIITILFGAVRDEETAVRAAGLRSLGMLITLPCLEDQTGFVMDLADLVSVALEDQNLGVRVKAAWALANLTDCLIRQKKNEDIEALPLEFLLPKLYKVSVKASGDNNKVRCNSLRALGNVLYLSESREQLGNVFQALEVLIESATMGNDMKVRWNACRALGFVMSHQPDIVLPSNWRDLVFPEFCELIQHASNFKVRTNAAWALGSCQNFGKYAPFVWKEIVLALDNSKHVPNFVEYEHREALVEQLCLALGHVSMGIEVSDFGTLWPDIKDHMQDIGGYMRGFQERVLPEKAQNFMEVKLKLMGFAQNSQLKASERIIAEQLATLFDMNSL